MAGITDKPYRLLAREFDCGLIFTEMISDQALLYAQERTRRMIDLSGETHPIAMQLAGSSPEYMERAAKIICSLEVRPDIIDINMGCPATKVVKNHEGCALMRDLGLARNIMRGVLDAATCPVTVKMRLGWDEDSMNFMELAAIAQSEGISAITLHPRTREDMFSGHSRWDYIRQLKETLTIPVIGNGDVWEPEDARRLLEETGCDAVMIGRGAMGNPWIFRRTGHLLAAGELLLPPSPEERVSMALRHYRLMNDYRGEEHGVVEMRKHVPWYLKGIRGAAEARRLLNNVSTMAEVENILSDVLTGAESASHISTGV
jgi:nifR3 family TIM-barrel protein